MLISILILVVSAALFFFYIQTFCERVIRREFSRAYCQDVIKAIQLEYPRLQDAALSRAPLAHSETLHALQSDFMTLEYLLKNNVRTKWHLLPRERILFLYFRILHFFLPVHHALKHGENEAVLKMVTILQFLANLVGERLTVSSIG